MMKRTLTQLPVLIGAVLLVILGFALALVVVPTLTDDVVSATNDAPVFQIDTNPELAEQEETFSNIYNTVSPSVVAITISEEQTTSDDTTFFMPISSGSGFVVDNQGHIVTNFHVVDGAERIEVSMFDGTVTRAELIGGDPDSDLAVIKVDVPQDRLHPVTFADSAQTRVGQMVFAIGNPFQNDWTLTSGIISALNRSIRSLDTRFSIGGVIQTDAAINPGNSGGPLVNLQGEVLGVNAQIASETRSNSGIGFAIPSNLVIRVMRELIETGTVDYSFMGITSSPINLDVLEQYNLPNNLQGVPVVEVIENTPASRAGLQTATDDSVDIITAIDGIPMSDFDEMIGYLGIHTRPGDTILLTVYRSGEIIEMEMTLSSRP